MKFPRTNAKAYVRSTGWKRKASALIMILLVFAPYFLFAGSCLAQTIPGYESTWKDKPDPSNTNAQPSNTGTNSDSSDPAYKTAPTSPYDHSVPKQYPGLGQQTTLAHQAAEQNIMDPSIKWDLTNPFGTGNDVYDGLHQWYTDDIFDNLFAGIGQLFGKWLYEFITGWMCDVVRFLTGALATFVLNPNIANNVANGKDDISMAVHKMADIMMSIAVDLLLLLFILCIWKYWAEANWRGMLNPMGSVMRLISTAGVLLAWPTIYSFVTELANQMIKAIWFNTADSMAEFDQAIVTIIKAGLVDTAAGLVAALAPVMGTVGTSAGFGGWVLGAVGGTVSFAAELIFGLLTAIIIGQLLVILMLKAVQTAILIAQYMFAPIFIVFFALPDTERFTVTYMNTFCMTSLWTFVWLALFRLLIIVLNSANNPWGKILLVLGVLQLMIQGPAFMMTGSIEPRLSFLDPKDIIDKVRGIPGVAAGAVTKMWDNLKGPDAPPPTSSTIGASASPAFSAYAATPAAAGAATSVNGQVLGLPGPKLLGLPNPNGNPPPGPGPNSGPNPSPSTPPNPTGGAGGAAFQGAASGATAGQSGTATGATAQGQGPNLGGGPGGAAAGTAGTPPVKQGPLDMYGPETKHKMDMGAFAKNITEGKIGFGYSDEGAGYVFGSKNDLKQINIPQGADADHVARRILVGASASLIGENDHAKNVAEQGSHKMGYGRAQKGDIQLANIEGKDYKESSIGKFRAREGAQRYAVEGSEAYYRGEEGNDYTKMLRQTHGDWDGERQADADSLMSDTSRPDSPFNASYGAVGKILTNLGIRPSAATRAAAAHSRIMGMPTNARRVAIQAVSAQILDDPRLASLDGPDKSVMIGQLTNDLSDHQVDVITEIYANSGGTERAVFNDHINAGMTTLTRNTKMNASQAYRYINQITGGRNNDQARVQASVQVVEEAYHAGMTDSHLFRTQSVEVGRMVDSFLANPNDVDLIREIGVTAKIVGGSMPTRDEIITVSSMRANGWNVYGVNESQLRAAHELFNSGIAPDRSAVMNHLNQNRRNP